MGANNYAYHLPEQDPWASRSDNANDKFIDSLDAASALRLAQRAIATENEKAAADQFQMDEKTFRKMYPAYKDSEHNAREMKLYWEEVLGVNIPTLEQVEESFLALRARGVLHLDAKAVAKENEELAGAKANAELPAKLAAQKGPVDKPVYGFDPATNETVATSQSDAQNRGLQLVRPVTAKQIQDDTMLNNRLVDVQNKTGQYMQSLQTPVSDTDKGNIAGLMKDFNIDFHGLTVPTDRINAAMDPENFKTLSPTAQQRLIAFRNAEEAVTGYQRVITGSARSSEKSLDLTLKTIPSPWLPEKYSQNALSQFQDNIKIAATGLPRLPGVPTVSDIRKQQTPTTPSGNNLSRAVTMGEYGLHQSAAAAVTERELGEKCKGFFCNNYDARSRRVN